MGNRGSFVGGDACVVAIVARTETGNGQHGGILVQISNGDGQFGLIVVNGSAIFGPGNL